MAGRPVRIPASNSARRLFVMQLVTEADPVLDMEKVWDEYRIPSHIVRAAVKDLAEAGLVTVLRDRYVLKAKR